MPNPKDLHGFLGRTQKWLQKAMDEGDEQSVAYYEGLMDRGGALAERMIQQQQQPPASPFSDPGGNVVTEPAGTGQQKTALKMTGYMPVQAAQGNYPFNEGFPKLGRVMGVNQQQSQYNPDVMYNVPSGNGGGQQPQQQAPQQAVTPPQAGAEPVPMFSFRDLAEMNGSEDKKMKADLSAPAPNPFAPPKSPEDQFFGQFPKKPSPGVRYKGPASPAPTYAEPSEVVGGFALTDLLPWRTMTPADEVELAKGSRNLKSLVTEPIRKWGSDNTENELSEVPLDAKTGKPVTWTEEQTKPGGDVSEKVPPIVDPAAGIEPGVRSGDMSKLSKFDTDWAFRKRINDMSNYGLSADKQAANTAEFDRKAEFEKRVKEEYGDKPSVLMEIAGLLLGGARGLDAMSRKKAAYMQGRRAIGREMRNEKAMAQKQMLQYGRQKVDDEVARQKMFYATLSDAAKLEMRPHLAEIDRIGAQLTSLTNNPATKEDDPRIFKLQQALQEALDRAKQVTGQYYGQVIPQANKGNVQE